MGQKSQIRLVSELSWERLEGKSAEKLIAVTPRINLTLPTSVKVNGNYEVIGQILPAAAAVNVTVKRNGVVFANLVTDQSGGFKFMISEKEAGLATYQVVTAASASADAGSSQPYLLLVR